MSNKNSFNLDALFSGVEEVIPVAVKQRLITVRGRAIPGKYSLLKYVFVDRTFAFVSHK